MASSTIFKVFGMTRPGIEPRSPEPLANILLIRSMARRKSFIKKMLDWKCLIRFQFFFSYSLLFLFLFIYFFTPNEVYTLLF